jgi:hypothetical protein
VESGCLEDRKASNQRRRTARELDANPTRAFSLGGVESTGSRLTGASFPAASDGRESNSALPCAAARFCGAGFVVCSVGGCKEKRASCGVVWCVARGWLDHRCWLVRAQLDGHTLASWPWSAKGKGKAVKIPPCKSSMFIYRPKRQKWD